MTISIRDDTASIPGIYSIRDELLLFILFAQCEAKMAWRGAPAGVAIPV
jgi:hypothetical protein